MIHFIIFLLLYNFLLLFDGSTSLNSNSLIDSFGKRSIFSYLIGLLIDYIHGSVPC
jgi:hypothetical protein